ncbi:hypothetical protein [Streptomyces sp. NBC_00328]|uniref:hypothetical protein n=1 Tax=Streptomyces sp. NBC_00328 TaxID=2903646 RepID=UPI002E2C97F6|nr:hypothetical protein [Streptomyces sp. NBC_00328]
MTESRASGDGREASAKMTLSVCTVSRTGVVTRPRAVVVVPYDYQPDPVALGTLFPECACPLHRRTGVGR